MHTLKLSVYGYDPLHIQYEISMFLTLNSKISFDKSRTQTHDIYFEAQNQNGISKTKTLL